MQDEAQTQFDSLWEFGDPAGTEAKFRALDAGAMSRAEHLQLQTQIARALGLQGKFDQSHALLDHVQMQLHESDDAVARVRYLLERGRAFNSSGQKSAAMPLFVDAMNRAIEYELDFYAVDAMHMIAIAEPDSEKQLEWNFRAIKFAESSASSRARGWLGSLYNNLGWTYFAREQFDDALEVFGKALKSREASNNAELINIAHYSVAKTLRKMGRIDEAMAELSPLNADGFVCEEIAECLLARGDLAKSRSHFACAFEQLSKISWLVAGEPERLERIRMLSEGA